MAFWICNTFVGRSALADMFIKKANIFYELNMKLKYLASVLCALKLCSNFYLSSFCHVSGEETLCSTASWGTASVI